MSAAVRAGYKQTEVGVIPKDWDLVLLQQLVNGGRIPSGIYKEKKAYGFGSPIIKLGDVFNTDQFDPNSAQRVQLTTDEISAYCVRLGDIFIALASVKLEGVGKVMLVTRLAEKTSYDHNVALIRLVELVDQKYIFYLFKSNLVRRLIGSRATQVGTTFLKSSTIRAFTLPLPPTKCEQCAISTALSDVDALLAKLDALIAKKRDLKVAAMQQLLTGQTRLPGFSGEWEVKRLGDITECLDNLRVPLNESQRNQMRGDYPYCGANGVLDFVNDYVLDDDVILMAEDGGYFDEYAYRPIAYRMIGKCWINNHAHILKAKAGFDQTLLFYLLVHKNIQSFLASGTRAKLNKSQMNKIEVCLASDVHEQTAIATFLSDMDAELTALEARRDKTRAIKQGMMQVLLTGHIRLV